MADDEETTTTESAEEKLTAIFLKQSGYKAGDIIAVNVARRAVATSNGGKYVLAKSGLRRLSGPRYPKEVVEE